MARSIPFPPDTIGDLCVGDRAPARSGWKVGLLAYAVATFVRRRIQKRHFLIVAFGAALGIVSAERCGGPRRTRFAVAPVATSGAARSRYLGGEQVAFNVLCD